MFAKIPQRLAAPFGGLLNDEAKLAFRSQPNGIAKLATTRNISQTDPYWDQYVTLFDSASDVFSLITAHDIRRALLDAPENIGILIRVICFRLFNLAADHTFPSPPPSAVSSFIKSSTGSSSERNTTKETLNCVRILTRILPVVFEVEGESSVFENEVLWKAVEQENFGQTTTTPHQNDTPTTETSQFVIEDDDDDEDGDDGPSSPVPPPKTPTSHPNSQKNQSPSLAKKLYACITDLLFCCGFTLPTKLQVDHHKINYVIWEKGIGSTTDPGMPPPSADAHKAEMLRLLLVLLSRQIYVPPASLFSQPSRYTLYLVQDMQRRDVLTILCSLLNTALKRGNGTQATSMVNVASKLPYNHLVWKEDSRGNLIGTCFEVLCALLDFQGGAARDVSLGEEGGSSPTTKTNAFRYFLAKLHRTQDFEFILEGTLGIMEEHMAVVNNVLPGAKRTMPYVAENIIFFWKMIELNKKFRTYMLQSNKSADLIALLLCYCMELKDKPQQHGLCRALSYIVQTLSAEIAFGHVLGLPVHTSLPQKWAAWSNNCADFMICSTYSIVATTSGALNALYPAFIIALANAAPHLKNLSVTASTRLVQMFQSFSNPAFLLADEGHPRVLFFMLEVLNSIIQHNMQDSPNLLYAVLVAHKRFEDLGTFTLARGLREIRRIQLAKEEQQQSRDSNDRERPHEEKARLLERHNHEHDRDLESGRNSVTIGEEMQASREELARPLTSPTSELTPKNGGPSEKARGKMRASRDSMSPDIGSSESLERIAAAGVGRNGFVPTQEWVTSWQQGLPLDPITLVITELLPKIQELQASRHKANSASFIIDFLKGVSLNNVLPPTPAITPRKFIWTDASVIWLTSLIWGEIYVRGMTPLGIWNGTNVRLFHVKHTPSQQRQLTEAVSSVVGGLGGLLTRTDSSQSRGRDSRRP